MGRLVAGNFAAFYGEVSAAIDICTTTIGFAILILTRTASDLSSTAFTGIIQSQLGILSSHLDNGTLTATGQSITIQVNIGPHARADDQGLIQRDIAPQVIIIITCLILLQCTGVRINVRILVKFHRRKRGHNHTCT